MISLVFTQGLLAAIALTYGTAIAGLWLQYRRETMRAFALAFTGIGLMSGATVALTLLRPGGVPQDQMLYNPRAYLLGLGITATALAFVNVAYAVLDPARSRRRLLIYGGATVAVLGLVLVLRLDFQSALRMVLAASLIHGLYLAWRARPCAGRNALIGFYALLFLRPALSLLPATESGLLTTPAWYAVVQVSVTIVAGFLATMCIFAIERAEAVRLQSVKDAELARARRMESLGRMASGVAHDFNNILFVIQSSAWLAFQDAMDGRHDSTNASDLEGAVKRGTELITGLLRFAKRGVVAAEEPFDAASRLEELAPILQRLVGNRIQLAVTVDYDTRARATVACDAVQFEQAFMNLAANARDAIAGEGQVQIRLSTCAPTERPHDLADVSHLMFRITDTGAGMSDAVLDRLFEPFFTTKDVEGTGLGLASVHAFVQSARGAIDVQSEVGAGTTFRLFLPIVEAAMPARVTS